MHVVATSSAIFFTNTHNLKTDGTTLCGLINSCSLKVAGCQSDYTEGNVEIDATTGAVTAKQNVDPGYVDTICVECKNTANSVITFDNWVITQKPNCETLTLINPAAKDFAYDTALTTTAVYIYSEIFANSKATAVAPLSACPITSCTLTQSNCADALVAPFDSLLSIEAATPWTLRISQTQVTGYPDVAVCYSCTNYKHTM